MSRPGRLALYLGTAVAVVGMSKLHAVAYGYMWSTSSRFAWSILYILVLCVTAYACGLPEEPRTLHGALLASTAAAVTAALALSAVQLVLGDAVLPRFVVLGAAVVLVPWYALSVVIARDGRVRATERDRVVVVAECDEIATLDEELADAPERPAIVVGELTPAEAEPVSVPPSRPLFELAQRARATVVVLSRGAQNSPEIVAQASELHERGMRIRTLALFHEQWLGNQPIGELERMSLLFDIGEIHALGYARVKRLFDIVLSLLGLAALALVVPFVLLGDLVAQPRPARVPPAARWSWRCHVLDPEVPHHAHACSDEDGERLDEGPRRPDHAVRERDAPHAPRRAAAGRQHPARRAVLRRAASRAAPGTSTS